MSEVTSVRGIREEKPHLTAAPWLWGQEQQKVWLLLGLGGLCWSASVLLPSPRVAGMHRRGHTSGKEWCGGTHWDPTLCLLSTVGYPKGKCFMGWWRHSSGLPVQGNLGRRCVWDEFGKLGFQQGFTEPPVGGELCESPGVLSETGR